jgi:hypothetical protein
MIRRKLIKLLNLLSQGVILENTRISVGGGAYDYRLLDIDRAMT